MENINYIEIGTGRNNLKPRKWVANFSPRNEYKLMGNIPQANDGTLHYENVDGFYFPKGNFEFNFLSPEDYSEAVQLINGVPFVIRYFDPEILMIVIRKVKLTSRSTKLFINSSNSYIGASNLSFEVESVLSYRNYDELKINDGRF